MSNKEVDTQKEHIKDFLKGLTRPEKVIVVLYYYEELTVAEIAKALELSESEVSQMRSSITARGKSHLLQKGLL